MITIALVLTGAWDVFGQRSDYSNQAYFGSAFLAALELAVECALLISVFA